MLGSSAVSKCGCLAVAATVAGLLDRTVALAAGVASRCEVFEYYDVIADRCRHCDTACFDHENGTIVSFLESRCADLCPGYIKEPRLPQYPGQPEEVVKLTLMEGGLFGFLIALLIVSVIAVILLRSQVSEALKRCCRSAKRVRLQGLFGDSEPDVNETSYVKLADPSDEVEIIDRVTCV